MISSKDYIIGRLNEWYAGRFREKYTDEVADFFIKSVEDSFKERNDGCSDLESKIIADLSREEQVKSSNKYFTELYEMIEIINYMDGVSKGEREEYLNPILEIFEKMDDFVENVRTSWNEDNNFNVGDENINKTFIDVFGGYDGFSEFVVSYLNVMPYFFDLLKRKGRISEREFKDSLIFIETGKGEIPYLNEIIFGDLKRG